MPTYALVVRKHNKTVRGFLVTTIFHKVLPGQNVPIGIPGFVGRPCTDLNLKAGVVPMNTRPSDSPILFIMTSAAGVSVSSKAEFKEPSTQERAMTTVDGSFTKTPEFFMEA